MPKTMIQTNEVYNMECVEGMKQLPDESVDLVYADMMYDELDFNWIDECFRVLIPGAPIRIICPDPRKFIYNWQLNNTQFVLDSYGQENWNINNYGNCLNIAFTDMFFPDHYDHHCCPPIDLLSIFMIRIGFKKVYEQGYSITSFPQFFGSSEFTIDNRPHLSYYLEAVK